MMNKSKFFQSACLGSLKGLLHLAFVPSMTGEMEEMDEVSQKRLDESDTLGILLIKKAELNF